MASIHFKLRFSQLMLGIFNIFVAYRLPLAFIYLNSPAFVCCETSKHQTKTVDSKNVELNEKSRVNTRHHLFEDVRCGSKLCQHHSVCWCG